MAGRGVAGLIKPSSDCPAGLDVLLTSPGNRASRLVQRSGSGGTASLASLQLHWVSGIRSAHCFKCKCLGFKYWLAAIFFLNFC